MIGETVLHYRVERLIGQGGMSTVYEGTDTKLDRPVAIKVLNPFLAQVPGARERFETEAKILARLNHPNIVSVHDIYVSGDLFCIVLEHIEGRTLADIIHQETGPMPLNTILEIMRQALRAIDHAHAQGLIHRDLKPGNIMITDLRGQLAVKVMDFGVAKILGKGKGRTATGSMMGTLGYMSPEQLASAKGVSQLSDLYSLGVTLYEMATGKVPFDADSEFPLMEKIVREAPPPPSSIYPGVFPAFEQIILKAIAKNPQDRYQSASEFLAALEAMAASPVLPESKHPTSPPPPQPNAPRPEPQSLDSLPAPQPDAPLPKPEPLPPPSA